MSAPSTVAATGLEELRAQCTAFVRAHLDPAATATAVRPTDGHAGFAYLVDVHHPDGDDVYFLRLPPPGVKREGTADVLRQVCALESLSGTNVPHARVRWSGSDSRWFGAPYFLTDVVPGETAGTAEAVARVGGDALRAVAARAAAALAEIHAVDWRRRCRYLGEPRSLEHDIVRWDRFAERAAEPQRLELQPAVRERLLGTVPRDVAVGLCHGDFQFGNLMCGADGTLHAVIDWELCAIAPVLTDVGWITAFHDRAAWGPALRPAAAHVDAAELQRHYEAATGEPCRDLPWFQALALYKYAVISGFNLMLHRRGKRHDPAWELRSQSAPFNLRRALDLLGGE